MATPTYANLLQLEEVSLGLEHLCLAPGGTVWTPGRIDTDAPPTGFIHLGAVLDDSPQITVTKELYTRDTGIPRTRAYQAVVGMSGDFTVGFHSHTNYINYLSTGGLTEYITLGTTVTTIQTATSRTQLTLATTLHGLNVLDIVVTGATTAGAQRGDNQAWVTSVTGSIVFFSGEGLPRAATAGDFISKITMSQLALGTSFIPTFVLLGVADFIDGAQVVHLMKRAQPRGQWAEALRVGADITVPAAFDLLGYNVSTPYSTVGQLVVAERYWFPPTTIA